MLTLMDNFILHTFIANIRVYIDFHWVKDISQK